VNPFIEDFLVAEHDRDLSGELMDIHLQNQALKNRDLQPNLFTNTMRGLGQWLIVGGEKLVKRYEVPSNSSKPSKHRYAH
jgi:hypothetical protein